MPETIAARNTFCWDELATSDVDAAKRFYGRLFGWITADVSMGPMPYTFARIGELPAVGMMKLRPEHEAMKVPPHWLSWVHVDDADAVAARVSGLGGRVLAGPMDYGDMGRGAVIAEPTGAAFALWQPKGKIEARVKGQAGAVGWNEILTTNIDATGSFLAKLLGWRTRVDTIGPMTYTTFLAGEERVGGMLPVPQKGMPASWLVYFVSDDIDRSVAQASQLGGAVLMPAYDVPGVGRFATLRDPQGAVFALAKITGTM